MNILTAEIHFKEYFKNIGYSNQKDIIEWGIEFAKLHCIEQARIISEKATTEPLYVPSCDDHTPYWGPCVSCGSYHVDDILIGEKINKDSILNAYSLDLIK